MSSSTHVVEEAENNGKKGKAGRIVGSIALIVLVFISVFLLFAAMWLIHSWAGVTMEEIVYHLSFSMEGANNETVIDYIFHYGIPTLLITAALAAAYIVLNIKLKSKKTRLILNLSMVLVSVGCLTACVLLLVKSTDVVDYLAGNINDNTFIEDNYVEPQDVAITFPEQKRNLIYIYLESMEVTYSDKENGGDFDTNLIPNLTQLSKDNIDFSGDDTHLNGGVAYAGATWTMGAMFTMSTGLPLKTSLPDPNDLDTQESMFPGVTAIGDILKDEGYQNALMIGSPASFGGRELFYRTHGDYEILDFAYAKKAEYIPSDYSVFWGYEDEKLYEFSKKEIKRLAESGEPFNFTMLTVDSHATSGYVCRLCENETNLQYANVMECADRQIIDFVEWIQAQDFYENTTVVIVGDHPTMSHDFDKWIDDDYQRKVYTTIINPAVEYEDTKEREYSTLDMFPTTLAAMGVEIEGDKLGLGTNLFEKEKTLTEQYGTKRLGSELAKKSEFMESLNETSLTMGFLQRMEGETKVEYKELSDGSKEIFVKTQTDLTTIPNVRFHVRAWGADGKVEVIPIETMEKQDALNYYIHVPLDEGTWFFTDMTLTKDDGTGISFGSTELDGFVDVVDYLKFVNNIKDEFDVFISAKDDMSYGLDEETVQALHDLGLKENLYGKLRYSYAVAIINGEVTEKLGKGLQLVRGRLEDDTIYMVTSAGYESGNYSSVLVDGVEYSVNERGLNFVLRERDTGRIIYCNNFDTCLGRQVIPVEVAPEENIEENS